jgi:membrane fusion protein, multidrug efflux system
MNVQNSFKVFTISALAALFLSACTDQEVAKSDQPAPAPQVSVAQVVSERITEWDEFTGRLQAPQTVELIPRVSGYVDQVLFKAGALVKAGDVLFTIDERPFVAEVARLQAELQSAQSAAELAELEFNRAQRLFAQRAVSGESLDNRKARKLQTAATVSALKAALERAELDVSYTRVTAPISGRVSYAKVTAGNHVTAGLTQLTSLVSTDKMYAYFDVDEQTYLKYVRLQQEGKRADTRNTQANPVYMALADSNNFSYIGHIDSVDNRIDPTSGTMRLRASFPNQNNQLLPGLFAKLRLAGSATYDGILIDEKSIGTDLGNKFVLVVNAKNELEYRAIELGEKLNGLRIVNKGLTSTDRIVVNGLQRVRPNMQITPQLVEMATASQLTTLKETQQALDQATSSLAATSDIAANRS